MSAMPASTAAVIAVKWRPWNPQCSPRTASAGWESSSSSCPNVSCVASCAPVPASSSASFVGYSSLMTSSVLPSRSSNVTVVTDPASPLSSFVQTMRLSGTTSRYLPKNAIGFAGSSPNTRRYLPPVRTSISHERSVMPMERGTHHFLNNSGLDHASNTSRAGASNVRVTTTSRSDVFCTVVRWDSLSFLATTGLLLAFEFVDDTVQRFEARVPHLAVTRDPLHLLLETARADAARAHSADLFGGHEAGQFEHADVLFHAREGHFELVGEVGDGGVAACELVEDATAGGVGKGGEGGVEVCRRMLNHVVQYGGVGGGIARALTAVG